MSTPKITVVIVVGIVAAGIFFLMGRDGVKTSYVNGLTAYNQLPNQEFIFQRDCYIFKMDGFDSAYPLVASHEIVPQLPAEVSTDEIGRDHPGVRLLDIVRIGDRFRILSVRREESRAGTTISLEVLLENPDERAYPRIDIFFLLDQTPVAKGEAPTILTEYAVRRIKG